MTDQAATRPRATVVPLVAELPPLLADRHGQAISDPGAWAAHREDLLTLFRDEVYGELPAMPDRPVRVECRVLAEGVMAGAADLHEFRIDAGPVIQLLVISPSTPGPHPVVVGVNRAGNHTVLGHDAIPIATNGVSYHQPETEKGTGRGDRESHWSARTLIERGYALATYHAADVAPDHEEAADATGANALSAWAWGLHRAVDALVDNPRFRSDQIILFGHSRRGKAALWAAALDPRVAAVVPHQSGRMGAALSRHPVGEPFGRQAIRFPHWLSQRVLRFGEDPSGLPVDQHMLIAAVAPRPILVTTAIGDTWSDPGGQYLALRAALPAYHLLGHPELDLPPESPAVGTMLLGRAGFSMLEGEHGCDARHWKVILDFTDRHVTGRAG